MDFIKRVAEYDSLPEQYRLDACRILLRETEFKLLGWLRNQKLDHISVWYNREVFQYNVL